MPSDQLNSYSFSILSLVSWSATPTKAAVSTIGGRNQNLSLCSLKLNFRSLTYINRTVADVIDDIDSGCCWYVVFIIWVKLLELTNAFDGCLFLQFLSDFSRNILPDCPSQRPLGG